MIPDQLSENFFRFEFVCHGTNCCGKSMPVDPMLVKVLQDIRDYFGKPIHINRGFSCIKHNSKIGGSPHSWHTVGGAADCKFIPTVPKLELYNYAIKLPELGGFGFYDTHWHVDIRPRINGEVFMWDRRGLTLPKH